MIKIAIVGSEEKHWTFEQRRKAVEEIEKIFRREARRHFVSKLTYPNPDFMFSDDVRRFKKLWNGQIKLISGGCPKGGVDIWAEIIAVIHRILKKIFHPKINQWNDRCDYFENCPCKNDKICTANLDNSCGFKRTGYKSRNIQIAEECDVLYCIDPKNRKWSGGRWTMNYAKKLGKEVHLVLIE